MSATEARVTFRLDAASLAALDALAVASGETRSEAIRTLLASAVPPPTPPKPMPREEVIRVLERKARSGSVHAARELLRIAQAEQAQAELDALNAIARGES